MAQRYYAGIDLGTTNSALAYAAETTVAEPDASTIRVLPIPQHTAPGRLETRLTLPSFLLLGEETYIGLYAQEQGVIAPARLVHSAKSWLANPEVDRKEKILPWEAPPGGRVLSPVEASARYLSQIAEGWRADRACELGEQEVVIAVPASFDEEARELTVEAAAQAGLRRVTLLEEPAAAFYAWIAAHLAESARFLHDGMTVLVCDVGGGTSDFTLVRVNREGDHVRFTRTAVGKHLLLGGDNLDLTLAWLAETKLGRQLTLRQRSALRRQCCRAKEQLLHSSGPASVEITVLGAGASLVGGSLKCAITREEAAELALEGFLPFCDLNERPREDPENLFKESGLPYVSDPAITRHLAAFLSGADSSAPDAILFNGGFFIPEICRRRLAEVVGQWYGRMPLILENRNLDLAVAIGAAYYARLRASGVGVRVHGGLPRTHYLGIGEETGTIRAVCLVPRGAEEGAEFELDRDDLRLVANRAVSFRLYSSRQQHATRAGEITEFDPQSDEWERHAPLGAVVRYGGVGETLIPVKLGARLTEVGTLEVWAQSKVSEHRWRLQFQLRRHSADLEPDQAMPSPSTAIVSEPAAQQGDHLIREVFGGSSTEVTPEQLPSRLEQATGISRGAWPLPLLRRFADQLLALATEKGRAPAYEQRWLNLCGFCLRPGFGYPGDELRVERVWTLYPQGVNFARHVQCEIEWWILWGRLAGGLNKTQQAQVYQRLSPVLLPRKDAKRVNASLLREMWRTACSLELLPAGTRTELGETLLGRIRQGERADYAFWCLARLGARRLFYAPGNQVLPAAVAARWAQALLNVPGAAETVAWLAQHTGDPARDVAPSVYELIHHALSRLPEADKLLQHLEGKAPRDLQTLGRIYGEDLPPGLVFDTAENSGSEA